MVRETDIWTKTYTVGGSWSSVGSCGKVLQIEGITSWNTLRHVQGIAGRPGDESGMSKAEVEVEARGKEGGCGVIEERQGWLYKAFGF